MYTIRNYKTRKKLSEALAAGERVEVRHFGSLEPVPDGKVLLQGPHFPIPHNWSATATIENGFIVGKIK